MSVTDEAGSNVALGSMPVTKAAGDVTLGAFFFTMNVQVPVGQVQQTLRASNTCTVTESDAAPDPVPQIDSVNFRNIGAGDSLPFFTPAGPYVSLPRQEMFGFITNTVADAIAGGVPGGLAFNIPGAEYPPFSNIPVPNVEPLIWTSPAAGESVTNNTQLVWVPGSNPDAVIHFSASSIDFLNPLSGSKTVRCDLSDTGSWTFKPATKAAMGDNFMANGAVFKSRDVTEFHQNGNALLGVNRRSDNFD